jgi:hypothetical protein
MIRIISENGCQLEIPDEDDHEVAWELLRGNQTVPVNGMTDH